MIEAFQHVGIGVASAKRSHDFYRKVMGFTIKLNDHEEEMEQMVSIIGSLESMRIIMAMNPRGGGVVEIVEHTSSKPRPLPEDARWGDIGYLAMGVGAYGLDGLLPSLESAGVDVVTPVIDLGIERGGAWRSAFIRDPDGLLIELLETPALAARGGKPRTGGFSHVSVGVRDMDEALTFWNDIVGYDVVVQDTGETPAGMEAVTGGGSFRSVLLERSREPGCALPLEGGMVRLVQANDFESKPLYEGRRWGDIGIMEMALDVVDASGTYDGMLESGARPYCPATHLDMGMGSVGTFAYVLDSSDNILELVEVEKLGYLPPKAVAPFMKGLLKLHSRR